ncbi:uncharacterized protein LOC100366648 [Saccoglossus kowalevskii]|uniref:Metalloendopeptidase n=1 Tax=Saccoglossus kowalevskii TaxID=10224 RepID=A0ABM0GL61_SACKO|nr:PREDICTED: zinc metalloproteinase nas-14-like [Saccoglossus kowalevskii]
MFSVQLAEMKSVTTVRAFALLVLVHWPHTGGVNVEPPEEIQSPGAFESDMMLDPVQIAAITESSDAINNGVDARKALTALASRWPNAIVPYVISADSQGDSAVIREALKYWEDRTCLTFPPYDSTKGHTSRIRFMKDETYCWSWVGVHNPGGSQDISIGQGCAQRGTIVHEIGHAIGFWHEQSRPDRDTYVQIHFDRIIPGKESNFLRYAADTANTYNIPYDVSSLMHYGPTYFSWNGLNTIDAVDPDDQALLGQRNHLSANDVLLANIMYDCRRLANVALGKPTSVSFLRYPEYPSSNAVDGNTDSSWYGNSCTHTYKQFQPWFRVDLGSSKVVHEVIVTNRKDCCAERITGAEVRVGQNHPDFELNTKCGDKVTAAESSQTTLVFECSPAITGRYVSLQLIGVTEVLNFCEIEVMAESSPRLVNVAVGHTASISGLQYANYPASLAVNGNTNSNFFEGSCTHSTDSYEPWFKVDLDGTYKIHEVVITNRKDCCDFRIADGEVRAGLSTVISENTRCGTRVTQAESTQTTLTFVCDPPVNGRYVSLQLMGRSGVMNFCEMEVMAGA